MHVIAYAATVIAQTTLPSKQDSLWPKSVSPSSPTLCLQLVKSEHIDVVTQNVNRLR